VTAFHCVVCDGTSARAVLDRRVLHPRWFESGQHREVRLR